MSDTGRGITTLAHVQQQLADAARTVEDTRCAIHPLRTLAKAEREQLGRALAGVVGTCETVRLWLAAGAPK